MRYFWKYRLCYGELPTHGALASDFTKMPLYCSTSSFPPEVGEEFVVWRSRDDASARVAADGEGVCVDVLVVGDGVSGFAAAQSAVGCGVRVLCVGLAECWGGDGAVSSWPSGVEHCSVAGLAGVLRRCRQVTGALFRRSDGSLLLVHSKVLIDATGQALAAQAAGAAVTPLEPECCAGHTGWGASLGYVQLPGYVREVLLHKDEARGGCGVGERIVGEVVLQPEDIVLERRFHDVVGVVRGSFEDNGSGVLSVLLRLMPSGSTWAAWVPLRALLPRKFEGMLVVGGGLAYHWDAWSVLRNAAGLRELAASAGRVAATSARLGCGLREVPLRPLQRELVAEQVLPAEALDVVEDMNFAKALPQRLALCQTAAILQRPDRARRLLQAAFDRQPTVLVAQILAFLGDSSGRELLKQCLDAVAWEEGVPGDANTPLDNVLLALRVVGGGSLAMLRKLRELDARSPFSHLRAVCLYLQRWPQPEATLPLERLLTAPGVAGNASAALSFAQLRELYVAGALLACDPQSSSARRSLASYGRSPYRPLAVYAQKLLSP